MKALLKMLTAGFIAAILVGCAGTSLTAGGMNKNGGALLSYQDNNGQTVAVQHGGGLRAAPCEPFRAEGLMAWATELEGNSHQKRAAKVSNDNGRINCHSRGRHD